MLGSCMRKLQTVFNIAVADHKDLTDGIAVGIVKLVRSVQFTVLTVTKVPISHSVYQEWFQRALIRCSNIGPVNLRYLQ